GQGFHDPTRSAATFRFPAGRAPTFGGLGRSSYRYIMLYEICDDGQLGLRLGATGQNLYSSNAESTTHVHGAYWQINIARADAALAKRSEHNGVRPLASELL